MHKHLKMRLVGVTPLMTHNGELANPLNPIVIEMKKITDKRKKTEADLLALMDLEFEGGLYLDEKRRPVVPGELIEGMLTVAAKKNKKIGKETARAGLISDGMWVIEHDGPKSLDALKEDRRFRDVRGVKVTTSRIMRCRPIFRPWAIECVISYLPDLLSEGQVWEMMEVAGRIIGLGDMRPKYGRFNVERAA